MRWVLPSAETVKEAGPAAVTEGYPKEAVTKDGQDFSKTASGKAWLRKTCPREETSGCTSGDLVRPSMLLFSRAHLSVKISPRKFGDL